MKACYAAFGLVFLIFSMSGCSSVFYQPSRSFFADPAALDFAYEELYFETEDHEKLHAWFFKSQIAGAAKGTIVQFHGNAENMSSHFASLAWVTKFGYQLFSFDYRGYGTSSGKPSQKGTYLDGLAALEKAYSLHEKSCSERCKFIVYGQSIGGVISMRSSQDFAKRDKITVIVQDSTFSSYKGIAQEKLASFWLTWIFSPLGQLLISNEYASADSIKKNTIPVLVIHDLDDPVIGFQNGISIFENTKARKDFWVLDQGQHIGVFSPRNAQNRKKFITIIEDFF